MRQSKQISNGYRRPRTAGALPLRGRTGAATPDSVPPLRRPREPSGVELFGREPFTYGRSPRYYGTGVAGYESGPGFTGGYYGYGSASSEIPTELEREYEYDLYGESDPYFEPVAGGYNPARPAATGGGARKYRRATRARRYPPGPKGYQRSDDMMRHDICGELMRADGIDSSEVTVAVTGAKVTLEGTVPVRWMKHAIEDIAAACPSVQDVANKICVKTAASST
ncbi:MAG TPA: BON domain-containing protein [Steroidobacteraceae bacterium]|nr:BON domain-containing protein [Steroidobacteraceae bacterium]